MNTKAVEQNLPIERREMQQMDVTTNGNSETTTDISLVKFGAPYQQKKVQTLSDNNNNDKEDQNADEKLQSHCVMKEFQKVSHHPLIAQNSPTNGTDEDLDSDIVSEMIQIVHQCLADSEEQQLLDELHHGDPSIDPTSSPQDGHDGGGTNSTSQQNAKNDNSDAGNSNNCPKGNGQGQNGHNDCNKNDGNGRDNGDDGDDEKKNDSNPSQHTSISR